jgi:hypothetical protein
MVSNSKLVWNNVYLTVRVPKCFEFLNPIFEQFALCTASFIRCLGCVVTPGGVISVRCPVSLCFGMILECVCVP